MAVILRTECGKGMSIRLLQGIVLVLVLVGVKCDPQSGCEQARKDIEDAKLPAAWIENTPVGGETCGANSCCSKKAEQEMFYESKRQLDAFLRDSIVKISTLIDVRAKKFDVFFREMMNTSKIEFHEMFEKTYGKIYLQNSDVFSDFFKELEYYYKKGSTRLSDTLESFFVILYQRMFTVLNSQYSFDDKYLLCVSEHMKDVKPFGDVPYKFTMQLKRSFIATRTYYKSLSAAAESAKKLLIVGYDKDCERELVQMRFCGGCRGLRGAGVCSGYCTNVLQGCLRHHTAFTAEWDNFVDALDKVADRLVGPYNIEVVVEPLNIKISEAIMTFQESGNEVTRRIINMCGKPPLMRRRRKADYKNDEDNPKYEINYAPIKKLGHKKKKNKKHQEEEDDGPSLEKLIKEIKMKVRDTRQFWANLPYQFCNNITAPPSSNGECWNGTSIGEYKSSLRPLPGDSPTVKDQIYVLQTFTDQLRKAYHGEEVEFIDDSEDNLDGSGSGSGDFEIDSTEEEEEVKHNVQETDEDIAINEIPKVQSSPSTSRPGVSRTSSGVTSNTMSLPRAMAQFLLPIVLVWFGGAISELL